MKLVEFPSKTPDTSEILEVLESMKQAIISGEVIAFTAVGIGPTEDLAIWCGSTGSSISKLHMIGALSVLQDQFLNGGLS